MKPLSDCLLYGFVDTAFLKGRTPAFIASQLCKGGADLIQLRAKNSSIDEVRLMAEEIIKVTRPEGVGLVINDHLSVALEVGAEVCHLGQEDFFGKGHKQVSEILPAGRKMLIGLSTHAPDEARSSLDANADYIAIGPVFPTGTKPEAKPVTLKYVRWAAKNVTSPWFVIGGINLESLDEVLAAGARRVCVVSAILNTEDIAVTCRKFKRRLESATR